VRTVTCLPDGDGQQSLEAGDGAPARTENRRHFDRHDLPVRRVMGGRYVWRFRRKGKRSRLVLAYLRNGDTFPDLAAGFGVGTATAWRYGTETAAPYAGRFAVVL
jgi:hypothetical protein